MGTSIYTIMSSNPKQEPVALYINGGGKQIMQEIIG